VAEVTGIEWTTSTWNPIAGQTGRWHCVKISEACTNCYAAALNMRWGGPDYHKGADSVRVNYGTARDPLKYARRLRAGKSAGKNHTAGDPCYVFVCSMTDLHGDFVPDAMRAAVYGIAALCPEITFQILTKRPANRLDFLTRLEAAAHERGRTPADVCLAYASREFGAYSSDGMREPSGALVGWGLCDKRPLAGSVPWPLPNVWEGCTVENQKRADERCPILIKTPAAVRWISCEPVLGNVDFSPYLPGLDWIVTGGESGRGSRPTPPDWFRQVRDQCAGTQTAHYFKQWGDWCPADQLPPKESHRKPKPTARTERLDCGTVSIRFGKKIAGHYLDGVIARDFPSDTPTPAGRTPAGPLQGLLPLGGE